MTLEAARRRRLKTFGGAAGPRLLADVGGTAHGIAALSTNLTINGQTVVPTFRYEGVDATLTDWTATVGETLTAQGTGGTVDKTTPLALADRSVDGDGTRYWQASNSSFADITTEDIVVEAVFRAGTVSNGRIFSKYTAGGGYTLYQSSPTNLYFFMDGVANAQVGLASSVVAGVFYHVLVFVSKSGSAQMYINGVAAGNAVDTSSVGSITNPSQAFAINADPSGLNEGDTSTAYAAMWKRDAWLDTHLQADIAAERFARLTGTWIDAWNTGPNLSFARASAATLERVDHLGISRLYTVGPRWPRLERVRDKHGRVASGFGVFYGRTNLLTYSEQLDNAAWTKVRCSIASDDGEAADGETTADAIVEDGTAGNTHYIEQTFTQGAGAYTLTFLVQPTGRQWVQLELDSATDGAANAYFDCAGGVVGASSGVDNTWIRYLGGGRYEVGITDTRATAESCSARLYLADGDGGRVFSGASSSAARAWGGSVVQYGAPRPYIKTEGATVTATADSIYWASPSVPGDGSSYAADVLVERGIDSSNINPYAWSCDAGSSADYYGLYRLSFGDSGAFLLATSAVQQINLNTSQELTKNTWREWRALSKTDDAQFFRDGDNVGSDTSCTYFAPTNLRLGATVVANRILDGRVRLRVFGKNTLNNITDFGALMAKASAYISTPVGATVSTSFVNVGGTWTEVYVSEFTTDAAGIFTYTGTETRRFVIHGAVSGAKSGGGTVSVTTCIEKNGVPVTASEITRDVTGTSVGAWPVAADVELANGDTINFAQKISAGTETLTIDRLSCVILEGA